MPDLNAKQRKALDDSDFLLPKTRQLPVENEGHWRAAAGRIDQVAGLSDAEKKRLHARWRRLGKQKGWLKESDNQPSHRMLSDGESPENPWQPDIDEAIDQRLGLL